MDLLEQAVHTICVIGKARITFRRYTNSRLRAHKFTGSSKRSHSGSRKDSHSSTRKESHSSSEITTGTTKESQSGSKISTVLTRNDNTPNPESPVRQARTALDSNQGVSVNLTCKLTRKQQPSNTREYWLDFRITLTRRIGKALPIQKTTTDRV